jgi:hypothetical protein
MKTIRIPTSDGVIWEQHLIYTEIACAMAKKTPIVLDFINEGPDISQLAFYSFLDKLSTELDYNLENIIIKTSNLLETHNKIKIISSPPMHLLENAKEYITPIRKESQLKHFGIFIGRGNGPRLHLASYINKHYKNKSLTSYRFNLKDEFHLSNIGIETIIKECNTANVLTEIEFLINCPVIAYNTNLITVNKNSSLNHAQQLLQGDKDFFTRLYKDFFIEIVCESYFTGKTFFPTEKIWRPMILKTPFMLQGPVNFLRNLKKLGFKTFSKFWDESYDEDGGVLALETIKRNVDRLSLLATKDLNDLYADMENILEHNYQLLMTLTSNDFQKIYDEK